MLLVSAGWYQFVFIDAHLYCHQTAIGRPLAHGGLAQLQGTDCLPQDAEVDTVWPRAEETASWPQGWQGMAL
jgi:hypothetical protein